MDKRSRKLNLDLVVAAYQGDVGALEAALAAGANGLATHDEEGATALTTAATFGHAKCVELLIPVSDPKAVHSYALRLAAYHGREECVRLLIPASDPKALNFHALHLAAEHGRAGCVALLLPVSDPLAKDSAGRLAAQTALDRGHPQVAAMIEAFAQAQELSSSIRSVPVRPAPSL